MGTKARTKEKLLSNKKAFLEKSTFQTKRHALFCHTQTKIGVDQSGYHFKKDLW